MCLIDQSAAYDLLDHVILAEKLREYHFSDESICWVESYLGGRTQCVKVESKPSTFKECKECGAPQGSVMAGIFHTINSNDLPDCHDDAESIVYVDDDSDTVCDGDPEHLAARLHEEVGKTVDWLKDNRCDWRQEQIVGTRK